MNRQFLQSTLASLLILAFILVPTESLWGQSFNLNQLDTLDSDIPNPLNLGNNLSGGQAQTSAPTIKLQDFSLNPSSLNNLETTNPLNLGNGFGEIKPQDPEEALKKQYEEDRKRCEEEQGFNSLISKVGSLPNIITEGLTK